MLWLNLLRPKFSRNEALSVKRVYGFVFCAPEGRQIVAHLGNGGKRSAQESKAPAGAAHGDHPHEVSHERWPDGPCPSGHSGSKI
jgi:hypothetical protein